MAKNLGADALKHNLLARIVWVRWIGAPKAVIKVEDLGEGAVSSRHVAKEYQAAAPWDQDLEGFGERSESRSLPEQPESPVESLQRESAAEGLRSQWQ